MLIPSMTWSDVHNGLCRQIQSSACFLTCPAIFRSFSTSKWLSKALMLPYSSGIIIGSDLTTSVMTCPQKEKNKRREIWGVWGMVMSGASRDQFIPKSICKLQI